MSSYLENYVKTLCMSKTKTNDDPILNRQNINALENLFVFQKISNGDVIRFLCTLYCCTNYSASILRFGRFRKYVSKNRHRNSV